MSQPVGQELGYSSEGCPRLSISPDIVVRVSAHLRLAWGRTCLQLARGHLAGLCSLLALGCYHRKCGIEGPMDPGAGGGEKEWIQMGRHPLDAVLVTEEILQEKAVRRSL